ncbi:MAG: ABC transporter ATP-binding protein [Acholeplasmatales bacterium]|nr:MAG: ABC transporter ATP-binding protein [Acholeplasmatales bacterium]
MFYRNFIMGLTHCDRLRLTVEMHGTYQSQITGGSDMTQTQEKPFRRLIGVFPKKYLLLTGVFISIVYATITVTFGYLLKVLIDAAAEGDRGPFFLVLQVSIGLLIANALLIYFRTRTLGGYTENGLALLRAQYSERITYLTFDTVQNIHSGELLSRGTNDMNRIRNFTFNVIPKLIEAPLTALLALLVLLYLSWQLTLFAFVMIPVLIIGSTLLIKPIGPISKKVQEKLGHINTVVTDFIKGVEVSKAYNLETRLEDKNTRFVEESVSSGKQLALRRGVLGAFSSGFSIIPFITTFVFGGYLVIEGRMTLGSLLAFINLLNFLTWPLTQMSTLIGDAKRDLASANRVFEIIDQPLERSDGDDFPIDTTQPVVAFKDVSFSYPGDQNPVIKQLNFSIKHGESVAFVGPSGGGKSTVTKLLMGYYDTYEGAINVFGHDLRSWSLKALREKLALVSQDTFLFPESIHENIQNGLVEADESMVMAAAKKANAHDFIMAFNDGYQTSLNELGNSLSGGQKQRLSIARAIIKNAPILLLDEATSALDTESEAIIQETLDTLLKDKTSIIIAHRLSTIKNVHKIFVIASGAIVESGTHDTLLAQNGVYTRLYLKQSQLEEGDAHDEIIDF